MALREHLDLDDKDSAEVWLISLEARARNEKRIDAPATTSQPERRELTDLFLEAAGTNALTTLQVLVAPQALTDCSYKQFKDAILRHIQPKELLVVSERTKFLQLRQDPEEDIGTYLQRIRFAAKQCQFEDMKKNTAAEELCKVQLIAGLAEKTMTARILNYLETKSSCTSDEIVEFIQRQYDLCNFAQGQEKNQGQVFMTEKTVMDTASPTSVTDLPLPLKEEIALNLHHSDVFSLMSTDRNWYAVLSSNYFWRRYVSRHTPLNDLDPSLDFREVFMDYLRNRYKLAVADISVVWLNDYYLHNREYENSFSGHIVYLDSVCWLDISGTFENVYPGEYDLVWRMMVKNHVDVDDTTKITITSGEKSVEYFINEREWRRWAEMYGHKVWFETVTGRISVQHKGLVKIHLENHSGNWKTGVFWDYIQLRPVDKNAKPLSEGIMATASPMTNRYKLAVADISVIWLNDNYLQKREYENSFSGHIVYLDSVCWLDISGSFKNVDPDEYDLVWRMMVTNRININDTTKITITSGGKSVEYFIDGSEWRRWAEMHGHNMWFETVTGRISVQRKGPVKIHLENHSGNWKSGVFWDYIQLRPVGKNAKPSAEVTPAKKRGGWFSRKWFR